MLLPVIRNTTKELAHLLARRPYAFGVLKNGSLGLINQTYEALGDHEGGVAIKATPMR